MEWDINVYQEYSSIKSHEDWRRQDRPEEDAEESYAFNSTSTISWNFRALEPFRVPLEPSMKARGLNPKLWKWRQNDITWRSRLPNNNLRVNLSYMSKALLEGKKKTKEKAILSELRQEIDILYSLNNQQVHWRWLKGWCASFFWTETLFPWVSFSSGASSGGQ